VVQAGATGAENPRMVLRPTLSRAARGTLLVLVALTAWHLLPWSQGRSETVLSNVTWVVAPAVALWWTVCAWRRDEAAPPSVPARAFAVSLAAWAVANLVWAVYEVGLDRQVPTPSVADPFFALALVAALVGAGARLRSLVRGPTAVRSVTDGLLLGGSLSWTLWFLLLSASDRASVVWVYPVLGVAGASLCLVVMARVGAASRLPWLLRGVGLLAVAVADASWAYQESSDGFVGGQLVDVVWVAGYLAVGLAALAVRPGSALDPVRSVPARWETLAPYPPVALAILIAGAGGRDLRPLEVAAVSAIALLLVCRQVLSLVENTYLTRSLEARVAERTAELRKREDDLRTILQRISDVIAIVEADGTFAYVSSSAGQVLGWDPGAVEEASRLEDEIHPDDVARVRRAMDELSSAPDGLVSCELRLRGGDGGWRLLEAKLTWFDRPRRSILATLRDVTDRRALEGRLRQQAYHDSLTGLANRARLNEELDDALAVGSAPSLLLLDLDGFKSVNDTAGHQLGDEVLIAVAARLRSCTRPGDLIGRLGGDEFAVVVRDDPSGDVAVALADRILAELEPPLSLRGRTLRCSASIGVASRRPGGGASELVRDADVAMYVAKQRGRGRFEVFTADMHDALLLRRAVEERLQVCVRDGSFVLHYQPIVELSSGNVVGLEALVRLPDGEGGLVPPADFIVVAEESSLVVPLGAAVLRRACADALAWQGLRPDGPPVGISVNISTRQLQEGSLGAAVEAALESGLPPGLLTLEITEGALLDHAATEAALRRLRSIGVRLSVDDFGAGYSSLGRLRALPVDELKIDRSFVGPLRDGPGDAVVEVVLTLGERLGLSVVAEGIETADQARRLLASGCRLAQGYFFAHPAPAEDVPRWLRRNLMIEDSSSMVEML
jgi:diguanylate cyclase (GGDEF)-like protein/PAS domain S-box-containing protein